MKKEFKPCNMYSSLGEIRFAPNEEIYECYKKRGYSETPQVKKEEEAPKPKKNAKKENNKEGNKKD
tara:strand:+ start:1581 stop:1778 length:198 start_codon:yes stop_codon:yes gene_type:complete